MTSRKQGAIYDKWHRRVEGQIRHVIGQHPEWFAFAKDLSDHGEKGYRARNARYWCINGLAKRIVGEIVADAELATVPGGVVADCTAAEGKGDASHVLPSGRESAARCSRPGNPDGGCATTG